MKIVKKVTYRNASGSECSVVLLQDGSAAITGAENYIIEGADDAIKSADEILRNIGYYSVSEE